MGDEEFEKRGITLFCQRCSHLFVYHYSIFGQEKTMRCLHRGCKCPSFCDNGFVSLVEDVQKERSHPAP